jgi:hypothetical protein
MKKLYVEDVIEKYHLGGLVERVKITVKDKVLTTKFLANKKNLVGSITAPNIELEDCEFGIYDTTQLLKLIGITDHFIVLGVEKHGKIANKLLIADNEFNLEYVLADVMLTPSVPSIDEPEYDMQADVDTDFVSRFLKAAKALNTEVFIVEQSKDVEEDQAIKFTLGGTEGYTNKINFTLKTLVHGRPGKITKFSLEEFNEILAANKEFKAGKLSISVDGLLKIEFISEEDVQVSYILVGKE